MQNSSQRGIATTSSSLEVSLKENEHQHKIRWARKNVQQSFTQKNYDFFPYTNSVYPCNIFDFSAIIQAQVQMINGTVHTQQFGPVQIDPLLIDEAHLHSKSLKTFKIKVLSNSEDDDAWWGGLRVVETSNNNVSLNLYVCQQIYPIFISLYHQWNQNQSLFCFSKSQKSLQIKLGDGEMRLKKFLGPQATSLKIECESKFQRDLLIYLCLKEIRQKNDNKQSQVGRKGVSKLPSLDCAFEQLFSQVKTQTALTPELEDNIIRDIGEVIYTPMDQEKQYFSREEAFVNFQKFLKQSATEIINQQKQNQQEQEERTQKEQGLRKNKLGLRYDMGAMTSTQQTSFATQSFSSIIKKHTSFNQNETNMKFTPNKKQYSNAPIDIERSRTGFLKMKSHKSTPSSDKIQSRFKTALPTFLTQNILNKSKNRFQTSILRKYNTTPQKQLCKKRIFLDSNQQKDRKRSFLSQQKSLQFGSEKKLIKSPFNKELKIPYLIGNLSEKKKIPFRSQFLSEIKTQPRSHRRGSNMSQIPISGCSTIVKFCYSSKPTI